MINIEWKKFTRDRVWFGWHYATFSDYWHRGSIARWKIVAIKRYNDET